MKVVVNGVVEVILVVLFGLVVVVRMIFVGVVVFFLGFGYLFVWFEVRYFCDGV